jgi:CubicO group peptidase (beta-lactamase class C family)
VRRFSAALVVLIGIAVSEQPSSAQSLAYPYSVFERALESLRVEAGIPGIAAVIVQDGAIVWERGFGREDLEAAVATGVDTPFVIAGLSQAIGSTVLLRKCVDQGFLDVGDKVVRWMPLYPEPETRISQLLSHTAPTGGFKYDPARFSALTGVVEECASQKYAQLLAQEVFDPLVMLDSAPGQMLAAPTAEDRELFDAGHLGRYASVIRRIAIPYRVVARRATRNTDALPRQFDLATGIVASARDLAQFDRGLEASLMLSPATRALAMTQSFSGVTPLPTGLGWFVQGYNNEPIVWQFGVVDGAYSSLLVKVPNRRLTLVLLANSDGLAAPFALDAGDVTTSIFARIFLRTFLPVP